MGGNTMHERARQDTHILRNMEVDCTRVGWTLHEGRWVNACPMSKGGMDNKHLDTNDDLKEKLNFLDEFYRLSFIFHLNWFISVVSD